jgi:hypothetical protein
VVGLLRLLKVVVAATPMAGSVSGMKKKWLAKTAHLKCPLKKLLLVNALPQL